MTENLLEALRDNGVEDPLTDEIEEALTDLGIESLDPTGTGNPRVFRTTVRPAFGSGLPRLGSLRLEAPGLTSGLRAQLALEMSGDEVARWALDLNLDRVAAVVPKLRPAREHRDSAAAPTVLESDPNRSEVRIAGACVLRIGASAGSAPEVTLIDRLDAEDPFGDEGALVALRFEPPSFFVGGSRLGFTVDQLAYDSSGELSPAGVPAAWRGIALRRATLFLPPGAPLVGDVSLGVSNLRLGDPVGVEGTAFLEFGEAGLEPPPTLTISQEIGGTPQQLTVSGPSDSGELTATLQGTQPPAANLAAALSPNPASEVTWLLEGIEIDEDEFEAEPGDRLEVRFEADRPPIVCVFNGSRAAAPTVSLALGSESWEDVTSVVGTSADLAGANFGHGPDGDLAWRWDGEPAGDGAAPDPGLPDEVGAHSLELVRDDVVLRRVRVEIRELAAVLVGCRAGVFTVEAGSAAPVPAVGVAGTYALGPWHRGGELRRAEPAAALDDSGGVAVAPDTLAEVTTVRAVSAGTGPSVRPEPEPKPVTSAQVRFDTDTVRRNPKDAAWLGERQVPMGDLKSWLAGLGDTARFAVIGRCDDRSGMVGPDALTDDYNAGLADRRAAETVELLEKELGVERSRIGWRGEQTGAWRGTVTAELPPGLSDEVWLARADPAYKEWAPREDGPRRPFRRGEVHVYGIDPATTGESEVDDGERFDASRQRALVPGEERTEVTAAATPLPARSEPAYRVRAEVEWNDPSAGGLGEATPSRAELIVSWEGSELPAPDGGTDPVAVGKPDGGARPVWSVRVRWSHDRASDDDEYTAAIDAGTSPDGIVALSGRTLAAATGLAPALIGAADNPSGGDAALIAALVTALGAAATFLLHPDGNRTVVNGIEIDHLDREAAGSGARTRLTVDYTVELHVDAGDGALSVSTRPERPMKLRYKRVGVELDTAAEHWYDGIGLVVENPVPEVVDAGSWQLGDPLGELLRVTGVRSGAQSQWLEVDLAPTVDLGVVEVSAATVRIVFGAGGIEGLELRGLGLAVDIPGTLSGKGSLEVGGGRFHAGLELDVVPLELSALADLVVEGEMVALTVAVRFPAPIPFAGTGLGLFGLIGRFVANGRRAVDAGVADPVRRELDWLAKQTDEKYTGEEGQYALGFGAAVGSMVDRGTSFHALGMLTVEAPREAVIFAIVAEFLAGPAPVPSDRVEEPEIGLSVVGLVVIDEEAVTIALRGRYKVPGVLELEAPIGAWFPYASPNRSWLRIGSDDQLGREGAPVTLTLFPEVLDVRVWAFAMFHGAGFDPGLKGRDLFVFEGFAVGFGAGWEIKWSAGPIRLEAAAEVLAGFGTDPLRFAAAITVRGSLDLVVVSVSARGEIAGQADGNRTFLKGEFCGKVDCFFFSIEGCVEIEIGNELGAPQPPPSPVVGLDLVSRLGHVSADPEGLPGAPPTAWPDAIPVLHLSHYASPALADGDFAVGEPPPGDRWSGSRDRKYAFRVTGVRLEPEDGSDFAPPAGAKFETAWWWPGLGSGDGEGKTETRDLALLSWQPWTGLLPLTQPEGSPADPAGPLEDLCRRPVAPRPACAVGQLGRSAGPGAAVLIEREEVAAKAGRPPLRLRVRQPEDRKWAELLALARSLGVALEPAEVRPLHRPFGLFGAQLKRGWRLAALVCGGQRLGSLGLSGSYEPPLERASLVLDVCPVPNQGIRPEPVEEEVAKLAGSSRRLLDWRPDERLDRKPASEVGPPVVIGVRSDGREVRWRAREMKPGRGCRRFRYKGPGSGAWTGIRILPAPGADVTVIASCGLRWADAEQRRGRERRRRDQVAALERNAAGPAGTERASIAGLAALPAVMSGPPPRQLLPAATGFRVTVEWEWKEWKRGENETVPGPADGGPWQAGTPTQLRFRTAPEAPDVSPRPAVDLISESSFDPRATARYVTAVRPAGDLPHLLDDPIRICLSVDYLPALLDAYGYETRVEVRPTDVAPGSQQAEPHPPDVVKGVRLRSWQDDAVLRPVEKRVAEVGKQAPCVPDGVASGLAAEVLAELDPETGYDLLLLARPRDGADRVIHRTHFRTSRYRDAGGLLQALGFAPEAPEPVAPDDLLLSEGWSAPQPAPHDDVALDQALAGLGADPWPLAAGPRATAIWSPPGSGGGAAGWALAGLLLEAPEPIARRDRIEVWGDLGGSRLRHRRSTASGTRVLLAPDSPLAPGEEVLRVSLKDALRGRLFEGGAMLLGGPRTIRAELA